METAQDLTHNVLGNISSLVWGAFRHFLQGCLRGPPTGRPRGHLHIAFRFLVEKSPSLVVTAPVARPSRQR